MCVGSLIIAVLPSYATVGVWAPLLLLVARLLQGISLGGEYALVGHLPERGRRSSRRGFYSSFQYVTLIGGQVLAALVLLVMQRRCSPTRSWSAGAGACRSSSAPRARCSACTCAATCRKREEFTRGRQAPPDPVSASWPGTRGSCCWCSA